RARAPRARPEREVPAPARRVHVATRHDPGARPPAKARAARPLERGTPRGGRLLPRGARGRRRPPAAAGRPRERARLAPLRRTDGRPGGARRAPARARDRDGPPLSRAAAPLGGVPLARVQARVVPRRGVARGRAALAADLPRDRRAPARKRRRCDARVLRPWLTARRTTHRSA